MGQQGSTAYPDNINKQALQSSIGPPLSHNEHGRPPRIQRKDGEPLLYLHGGGVRGVRRVDWVGAGVVAPRRPRRNPNPRWAGPFHSLRRCPPGPFLVGRLGRRVAPGLPGGGGVGGCGTAAKRLHTRCFFCWSLMPRCRCDSSSRCASLWMDVARGGVGQGPVALCGPPLRYGTG